MTWRLAAGSVALLLVLALVCPRAVHAVPANAQRFTTAHGLPSNVVHAALEDRHGYLWFASDDGLARFDGRRFRIWRQEQGLPDSQVLALARDADDQLWLGTGQGQLVRMSADRHRVSSFDARQFPALDNTAIVVVRPGPDGDVWFGTRGNGLFRLGKNGRLRQFLPTVRGDGVPDRTVEHLVFTADGSLWVGTPRGLARWREGRFHVPAPALLATAPVSALLVDRDGALWVAGAAGPWRASANHTLNPLDLGTDTRALGVSGRGGTWLADGALVWRHGAQAPPISLASLTGRLTPTFRSAFEDRHGGLWLLGRHLGVWRLPPHWQHFQATEHGDPPGASLAGIQLDGPQQHQLQCADGTLWSLDRHAIERRSGKHATVQRWPWRPDGHPRLRGPVAVHCDGTEQLWWGTRGGLQRWSGGHLRSIPSGGLEVDALHVADDGALWVASPGTLRRFRVGEGGLQHSVRIDARHGLPALRFHSLTTDAQGVLWASAARGLVRVRPREGQAQLYTQADGVPPSVMSARLQAQGRHVLAIAADGRSMRFDPAGLGCCRHRPVPVVERVQVMRDGRLQVLPVRATMHLTPADRDIQVTVRRLGPTVESPHYRFRLPGQDRDWIRVGRRGTRGFPQLPPGTHRLEFQVREVDGHWSPGETLILVVSRSGWHHPLLIGARIGLGLLLVGGAVWATLRRRRIFCDRRRSLARRDAALQSARAKEAYLSTLGHEVRTPLTGVLGLSELLLASPLNPAQRLQLERIRQGGQTLLHVLNQALDEARIEAGCLPLMAQSLHIAAVCQDWQRRSVIGFCRRGTSLAVCLRVAADARVQGDPTRLMQVLDSVAGTLAACTTSAGLVLQVAWLPGREGIMMELITTGRRDGRRGGTAGGKVALLPTPTPDALRVALEPAQALVRALGGMLCLHGTDRKRWQVVIHLPLPQSAGTAMPSALQVLLVGAPAESAEALGHQLQAQGHSVVHAGHALSALAEFQARAFDMVILAKDLPGVDGLALLDMLRAPRPGLPALVILGSAQEATDAQAAVLAAGAVPLQLPGTRERLRAALQRAWEI
jgi:ligand-binding sensor domain-containing protein/CheY-like chemotaxis protein